jgi:hypothetical protein
MMSRRNSIATEGSVLSIDLAASEYSDNGFAFLPYGSHKPRFLKASDLGLMGKPIASALACAIERFSIQEDIRAVLLDGPQGWKSPKTDIEHMRLCERILNTPTKTGKIGYIKPKTSLRYVAFSIHLFHILRNDFGWNLLEEDWQKKPHQRWVVETFPSKAWQTLGLHSLPAKSKSQTLHLSKWRKDLCAVTDLEIDPEVTHDELQAAVVLPAGRAIAMDDPEGVVLIGMDPILTRAGDVLEGWIAIPRLT